MIVQFHPPPVNSSVYHCRPVHIHSTIGPQASHFTTCIIHTPQESSKSGLHLPPRYPHHYLRQTSGVCTLENILPVGRVPLTTTYTAGLTKALLQLQCTVAFGLSHHLLLLWGYVHFPVSPGYTLKHFPPRGFKLGRGGG